MPEWYSGKSGLVKSGQVKSGQAKSGQVKTSRLGQDMLDRLCQIRTGHAQLRQGPGFLEHVKLSWTDQIKFNRSSQRVFSIQNLF